MRCFIVVVLTVACAGAAAAAAASCSLSLEFFGRHDASADDSDEPGPICGGQCCGRGREERLRNSLQRVAVARAATTIRPIAELLLSTRRTLQDHLTSLSHQSQNKTAILFAQVYRGHSSRSHGPLAALYDDIRAMLRSESDRDVTGEDLGTPPPRDMVESTRKFFRDVFPVAYHIVLKLDAKQFKPEYEACLKDAYDAVQPFDKVPQQVEKLLSSSLAAARTLLQVLAVGAGALAASEQVLASSSSECSNKLLRVGGCARCRNHSVRPCRNYCLNVARGCLGSLVAELDAPWAGYVEGVERLARADADAALRAMDEKVSKAIMHAIESHVMLEKKVRQECGPPSTVDSGFTSPRPTPGSSRRDALRSPPPDTELLQFTASLAATKKLFAGLADKLCDEPDFAHEGNDMCWNGETVGTYTKPLVASASLSDQRYNPEVTEGPPQDPRVVALDHKLRQARQLLVAHPWSDNSPAAEAFMQGDEAGDEGSGSGGQNYPDDDAAYDAEGSGEEGSGRPDIVGSRSSGGDETTYTSTPKTDAATTSQPLLSMLLAVTLLTSFKHYLT